MNTVDFEIAKLMRDIEKNHGDPTASASVLLVGAVDVKLQKQIDAAERRIGALLASIDALKSELAHERKTVMKFKGDWCKNWHYFAGDVVRHDGSLFVLRADEANCASAPSLATGWEPI